jgi:hypothetical protein
MRKMKDLLVVACNKTNAKGVIEGTILLLELREKLQYFSVLEQKTSEITALDVSRDEELLIAGYANGHAHAYELKLKKLVYKFRAHSSPIVKILIITDSAPKEFVSADSEGKIYRS